MKTFKQLRLATFFALALCLWACGDSSSEISSTTTTPPSSKVEQVGKPNAKMVSEKWLKGQFPEQLGSQKLYQSGAKVTELQGFQVTKAQATYGDDNETVVAITDLAKVGSSLGGVTPWLGKELNLTEGKGFQRISFIENYPSLETYDANRQLATVSVLVGNRFLVAASSRSVRTSQLRDAVATMELDDLAKGE